MTINYNIDFAQYPTLGFIKTLVRWQGSVWQRIWKELLLWIFIYYIVFVIRIFAFPKEMHKKLDLLSEELDNKLNCIPLSLLIGLFVWIIVDRWQGILKNMGFVENIALTIAAYIKGTTEDVIKLRRGLIRYMVLGQILVFRNCLMGVRKRFPTYESIVEAGFMTAEEKEVILAFPTPYNKYWVPFQWALVHVERANLHAAQNVALAEEIKTFRSMLIQFVNYDGIPLPLCYIQVVFVAVRLYFIVALLSRQIILDDSEKYRIYFPVVTVIEYICVVGWMKVAEILLNPLGEDDDNFDGNFLIDKNMSTGLSIVDLSYDRALPFEGDIFEEHFFMDHHNLYGTGPTVKSSLAKLDGQENEEALRAMGYSPTPPSLKRKKRKGSSPYVSGEMQRNSEENSIRQIS